VEHFFSSLQLPSHPTGIAQPKSPSLNHPENSQYSGIHEPRHSPDLCPIETIAAKAAAPSKRVIARTTRGRDAPKKLSQQPTNSSLTVQNTVELEVFQGTTFFAISVT
jgi:hypothetical protein